MTNYIKPEYAGVTSTAELNDCTVRSLSNASGIQYSESHQILKTIGKRNDRKGAQFSNYAKAYELAGAKNIVVHGEKWGRIFKSLEINKTHKTGISVGRFIQENPKGRFVLIISRHATTVIDGKIIDKSLINAKSHVFASFDFTHIFNCNNIDAE
jgi:hypothetical protein